MRGLLTTLFVCALVAPAAAQPKKGDKGPPPQEAKQKAPEKGEKKEKDKVKNFDFNALDLNGRMRTPQLLYFLERANEELERASLEKRSFIPHMVRSVEEEQL
ncbi:MAG TPA: hypothetical protein VFV99_12890 [Kofleriaceae bacterium]|nr:hypothetical protein [Kofleriaceae bacterium]